MTKLLILTLTIFLSTFILTTADAASCKDLQSCSQVMHQLLGQRYFWEAHSDKKIMMSPELELTKENAELVFTALLEQNHLARVPVGDGSTFRLVPSQDCKDIATPIVEASADTAPSLPNTWDWVTMRYRPKSRELLDGIEKAYRSHISRDARLQVDYNAGFLILSGSAPMVRNMYEVFKGADVPYTAEVRAHLKAQREAWERKNRIPDFLQTRK